MAIQSSSAVTVMLVGLVNSGLMQLSQTVGVIMGSNIGTTVTAWLLSLAGIEGDALWLRLLKPSSFAPLVAFVGILLLMLSKSDKRKSVGSVCLGFAILMFGMEFMGDAVEPLAEMPEFAAVMTAFKNPLFGVLIGTVVTAVIQSSSASVGLLQALSLTGNVSLGMAIPIIMGQNIGTTVTAAISSIGVHKSAKRVAVVHAAFNLIGTAVLLTVFWIVSATLSPVLFTEVATPFSIAVAHSIFNVATTLLLLPCSKLLVRLANLIIREGETKKEEVCFLDERLFATPSLAVSECAARAEEMSRLAHTSIRAAMQYLHEPSEARQKEILGYEDRLDRYEDALGKYLVSLSALDLSVRDSRQISEMLHAIGNFERIGDHAVNLLSVSDEIHQKGLSFSDAAKSELAVLERAITDILSLTEAAFEGAEDAAVRVEPLEEVIDTLIADIRSRHIKRLTKGNCTVEMGFVLADLLNNYERVSDHCSNLAVAVIEAKAETEAGAHAYLQSIKESFDFDTVYKQYLLEYPLD
jgi:phosphate:Na+ symporter